MCIIYILKYTYLSRELAKKQHFISMNLRKSLLISNKKMIAVYYFIVFLHLYEIKMNHYDIQGVTFYFLTKISQTL